MKKLPCLIEGFSVADFAEMGMAEIHACGVCGCTEECPCWQARTPGFRLACHWIRPGLCSACLSAVPGFMFSSEKRQLRAILALDRLAAGRMAIEKRSFKTFGFCIWGNDASDHPIYALAMRAIFRWENDYPRYDWGRAKRWESDEQTLRRVWPQIDWQGALDSFRTDWAEEILAFHGISRQTPPLLLHERTQTHRFYFADPTLRIGRRTLNQRRRPILKPHTTTP